MMLHVCTQALRLGGAWPRRWLASVVLSAIALGCSGDEVIVKTADGVELTAADIDKNPLALMPGGAVGMFNVEVPRLLQSQAGERLLAMTRSRLPVPAAANFVPERDLQRVIVGLYSFQGVDFVGVAKGQFDQHAIQEAAKSQATTPLGTPLVEVRYAGRTFYVSANVGFVVLTEHSVVFGNETGIRRALDRIEAGRIGVETAPEIATLMDQPGAPLAFASSAQHDPTVSGVVHQLSFLEGASMLRMVGNFEPPGLNLAGTLTYSDAAAAAAGQGKLERLRQDISTLGFLTSAFGLAQPIQRLDAQVVDSSLQVAVAVDSTAAANLLDALARLMGTGT